MAELAIKGGTPAFTGEFPRWPVWGEKEETNLLQVLDEGQWGTLGKWVRKFGKRFAEYVGVKHCVCVNNGTQGLEILLRAAGVGYGDEVVVPAYTFVATVSAVAMTGASPVFADVDLNTGCLNPQSVEASITERTKAIVAVHIAGRPCDMDALNEIAVRNGVCLLEDASHAHGSEWRGRRVGALSHGAVFSCQSSKNLTSGEGGLIVMDDDELYAECWHYHNSGRAIEGSTALGGLVLMGTNGRMSEWEAAVLDAQLDRLDGQNDVREENAAFLSKKFRNIRGLLLPDEDVRITKHGNFLYLLRIDTDTMGVSREKFLTAMNAENIPLTAGYKPLHRSEMLFSEGFLKATERHIDYESVSLPNTELLCETGMWLSGQVLLASRADVEKIAAAFEKVAAAAYLLV
jgi:dTDP-4-amino-4,6-dideoxygalactose transaminase